MGGRSAGAEIRPTQPSVVVKTASYVDREVIGIGIGLSPLLQWVAVPLLALHCARRAVKGSLTSDR